jgi:hypothetical protein
MLKLLAGFLLVRTLDRQGKILVIVWRLAQVAVRQVKERPLAALVALEYVNILF